MQIRAEAHSPRVMVLAVDPELGADLGTEHQSQALRLSAAAVLWRHAGTWNATRDADVSRDGFGLLVLDGALVRRVGIDPRFSAELLGPGDVVQPACHDGEEAVLPFEATWRVLLPLRLAVLDLDWATRMSRYPEIAIALHTRMIVRSRRMASMLAITHHPRLEERLWLFFWEIAQHFGRVRPDGVALKVPMTHELISYLVGARRPSVSSALTRLERTGRLARDHDGDWILHGDPSTLSHQVDGTVVSRAGRTERRREDPLPLVRGRNGRTG